MSNYWGSRKQEQHDKLYKKSLRETNKKLANLYRNTANSIERDMADLYLKIVKDDGSVSINDLYRYGRFFELRANINEKMKKLGEGEIKILKDEMIGLYNHTSKLTRGNLPSFLTFSKLPYKDAATVVENIWCLDGKHFSSRIWTNKETLQKTIERGLVDSVSKGCSKDDLVKLVRDRCGVGFSNADRVVRTELTNIQNQAAKDTYIQAGVEQYEYLAEMDEQTSDDCAELNGQIFNLEEAQEGINFPPMHPNCRSTIIPVINN